MFEIDRMGMLLVGLDQFDDLMLDVVERLCLGRWPVLGAPFAADGRQVKIVRNPVDVQIEKYLGGGPVRMRGLAQQTQ